MKGIILAGGTGTRLHPMTSVTSKQLMPVYDKPLIYYPLTTLMLAGIREILIITTPRDQAAFQALLGDGNALGLSFSYLAQPTPGGIAQAYVLGSDFVAGHRSALILGDNLFHGDGLPERLRKVSGAPCESGATVFAHQVADPERYGVVAFYAAGRARSIEEKPTRPRSNWAVTGLYLYDTQVVDIAADLTPSSRGELEISDINRIYLERGQLAVERLDRGVVWLDTGTPESLLEAAILVRTIEQRQGMKIGCPEEVAHQMGYIDDAALEAIASRMVGSDYGRYLARCLDTARFAQA